MTATFHDIHALAEEVQAHINTHWEAVYHANRQEMIDRYPEIGDSVYGIYGARLFQPIHARFKEAGIKATPRLPGNFGMSREWGPEEERQRWMWSKITRLDGIAIGTLVTVFYHDHVQVRIPRAFEIIPLPVTTKNEVIKALSARSEDFKNALEAKIEIEQYLASLQ